MNSNAATLLKMSDSLTIPQKFARLEYRHEGHAMIHHDVQGFEYTVFRLDRASERSHQVADGCGDLTGIARSVASFAQVSHALE